MIRRIQTRIILLIATIGVAIIAGLFLTRKSDYLRIDALLEKKESENSVLLNRVVNFKAKSLDDYVYDYTYWDEMVSFIKTNNRQWAHDMIEVSLPTFQSDYAWVYRADLSLLYSISLSQHDQLATLPLPAKELEALVAKGSLYEFYIKTPTALIQISGGSVHPTSDPDRKTPPEGYFFVGRIWKNDYLVDLEEFTGTSLSVLDVVNEIVPADTFVRKEFSFVNYKPMQGWSGHPVAYLRSRGVVEIARDFQKRSENSLTILAISLFLALGFMSFILLRSVNRPLRSLILSLKSEDPNSINDLRTQKSEFGHIAQLMSDFFIQKKKLVEEIEERIKIEKELIQAKDKAEESDRLKTAFLNNISHEIRTPMNAIVGFSDLIADPRITEQERTEFTEIISLSSYRLLGIITDLISISAIESGQMVVAEEELNLNTLLQGIFTQIKHEIDTKHVVLNLDVALKDDHSVIRSDRTKLTQVMMNLLKNSVKFTKSGRIGFGYTIRNAEIEFFVHDTGIGIPPEKFDQIFARFQQADDSLSREFGGAGLGLPISKAYVELLGGRIWLKSEVGKGTVFYFTIPYNTPPVT